MKAIAAMSLNRVIGRDGKIPWHIADDFRWFKKTTSGAAVLMGRKTFESLGRPLPDRQNLVVTRRDMTIPNVEIVRDLASFDPAQIETEVWVCGGAEIYRQLLPRCTELLLSVVQREVKGDAVFPDFETWFDFHEIVLRHSEFEVRRYLNHNFAS